MQLPPRAATICPVTTKKCRVTGDFAMKIVVTRTVATLAAIVSLGASAPALAQYNAPPPYGAVLPPFEVVTIIRSMGFDPVSRPVLRGPVYVVQALDDVSIPVRVIVDARSGNVVRVTESPRTAYMGVAPDAGFGPRRLPPETVPPGAVYRPYDDDLAPPAAQAPPPPKPKVAVRTPLPRPAPPQSKAAVTPPAISGTAAVIPDPNKTPGKSIPAPVANKAATAVDPAITGSVGTTTPESKSASPEAKASQEKPTVMAPVAPLE
jgi:hypothetical protein